MVMSIILVILLIGACSCYADEIYNEKLIHREGDVRSILQDHSPYCKDLVKVTDLCSEVFIHILCPKTCQLEDKAKIKPCGQSSFDHTAFAHGRKKRNDEDEQKEAHHRARRIVGGIESKKGAWPWQVALYFRGKQRCAGAILTPSWVITAAHCFDKDTTSYNERDWLLTTGDHSLMNTSEGTEQIRNIKKIIIHEKNYKYWKVGYKGVPDDYDVALLKLDYDLVLDNHTKPICLPGLNHIFKSTDLCKIMGWGSTSDANGKGADILREATVKLVPRDICNLPISYGGAIHERAICAGFKAGHTDACAYDSGGALSCKKGSNWFAVGLVSWGYQCGKPNYFGIYTNLPLMKSWVIEILLSYDDATNSIISIFERISTLSSVGPAKRRDDKESHGKINKPYKENK